jgi:hypothetical protein
MSKILVEKIAETAQIEVKSEKCAGVYDFKLLWRAQLYIDERKNAGDGTWVNGTEEASQLLDWNNANRWTYAQGNEWDKDWFDHDNDGIIEEAGPYNGGQCTIQPWTRPYDPDSEYHNYGVRTEYASVAYTALGRDTPLDFNADLIDQMQAVQHYLNMPGHNTTLAPTNNDWQTYIDHTKQYNGNNVDTNTYQPYRPVFSSLVGHLNSGDSFYDENWNFTTGQAVGFSAGTNCNGITLQAAAYNGSNYVYADDHIGPRRDWGLNYGGAYPRNEDGINRVWIMWEGGQERGMDNFIVPGDMVDMSGHCGVIYKVVFGENNREILLNRCLVLEATAPLLEYKIINTRNMQFHINAFNNFKIVRLQIKEDQ